MKLYVALRCLFSLPISNPCVNDLCLNLFSDFEFGDHFCVFRFKDGLVEKWYQLHYTDDYPGKIHFVIILLSENV